MFDCLLTKVYTTEGQLAVLQRIERQCLSEIIEVYKSGDNASARLQYCEVARFQFPASERRRSGSRQPVR